MSVLESWLTPNYVNPVTKDDSITVMFSLFTAIVVVVVSLRIYDRASVQKRIGGEDVFILLALVSHTFREEL
jgi:hypothetical protein